MHKTRFLKVNSNIYSINCAIHVDLNFYFKNAILYFTCSKLMKEMKKLQYSMKEFVTTKFACMTSTRMILEKISEKRYIRIDFGVFCILILKMSRQYNLNDGRRCYATSFRNQGVVTTPRSK